MAPPDVEGMIFQDGAYFVPVEGGYARLPSPLDQLVTPTTPDLESSVAGLGAKTQEFLAAGDKERARESLRTARRLVHGNEAISERARGQLTAAIDNSQAVYAMACGHPHTALRYLERALALNLHDGNDGSLATTCMNLTAVLSHLRHHDRALKLAEAAILLTAEETDPARCAAAYFNLAVQQEVMARGARGPGLRKKALESSSRARLRAATRPCGVNTVPPEAEIDSNLPRVKLFEAAFEECRPGRKSGRSPPKPSPPKAPVDLQLQDDRDFVMVDQQ
ncbi:hypothetical protein SO694_00137072 [Aureococcus anophagefferens]|uniref:MalT-like TPR region domain-containing protein n=1 Tax=Aureococcus anophagefferens TaxID=44056 RepID=A0ABR1GFR6_AURAN